MNKKIKTNGVIICCWLKNPPDVEAMLDNPMLCPPLYTFYTLNMFYTVKITTRSGKEIEFITGNSKALKLGSIIEIMYDESNPYRAVIYNRSVKIWSWLGVIFVIIIVLTICK